MVCFIRINVAILNRTHNLKQLKDDEHIYDEVKRLKKELAKVIQERDLLKRPQRTLQGKLCEVRMDN
ncbi:hypothetical protein [sulfur-oxidizing endosymbiont of Gigantopelta aegis]|uniref:hypothetical protein n=1 Tax=sulfur-oxidizing endosymbiont of Gigantopelta aegis TaxID=2794934 RepID=UPI001BE4D117|nr:hypothetical protein [sulfur-oxidizing endosymbiont of Gigantopelta aegis]